MASACLIGISVVYASDFYGPTSFFCGPTSYSPVFWAATGSSSDTVVNNNSYTSCGVAGSDLSARMVFRRGYTSYSHMYIYYYDVRMDYDAGPYEVGGGKAYLETNDGEIAVSNSLLGTDLVPGRTYRIGWYRYVPLVWNDCPIVSAIQYYTVANWTTSCFHDEVISFAVYDGGSGGGGGGGGGGEPPPGPIFTSDMEYSLQHQKEDPITCPNYNRYSNSEKVISGISNVPFDYDRIYSETRHNGKVIVNHYSSSSTYFEIKQSSIPHFWVDAEIEIDSLDYMVFRTRNIDDKVFWVVEVPLRDYFIYIITDLSLDEVITIASSLRVN